MFWDNFYNACIEKGIKPNPLAKELNIASGSMTTWKSGKIPNGETLIKIADYLDVSVDYLLGRTDSENVTNRSNIVNSNNNDNDLDDIKDMLNQLSKVNKLRAVADILELLEEKYIKSEIEAEPKINITYSKIYADEGGVTKKETPAGLPKISEFFDD